MKFLSFISYFFKKSGFVFLEIAKQTSPYQRKVEQWNKLDPKNELRFDYDLTSNSTVFDLGGFKGQWASDIYARYGCNVYVFEPVRNFVIAIQLRFQKNEKIKIFDFGLGNKNTELMISTKGDSSSLFKGHGDEKILIHCFSEFIKEHNITSIDLLKLNIEGAEYDLLDHIIENDLHKIIKNIQVQFHNFVPNANIRMKKIQTDLSKTHKITYQIEFVWENWNLM